MCQPSTKICTTRGQQVSFILLRVWSEGEPGDGGQVKFKGVHLLAPAALRPIHQADRSRIKTASDKKTPFLFPSYRHSSDTVRKREWVSNRLPSLPSPDHNFPIPTHLKRKW